MRITGLSAMISLALLCSVVKQVSADEPPAPPLSQIVGSVFGKLITVADIELDAPIDIDRKFDGRDRPDWELMMRITRAFGKPISDRFVNEQNVQVTPLEIVAFKTATRKRRQDRMRETEDRLAELETKLASQELPDQDRAALDREQATLERSQEIAHKLSQRETPEAFVRQTLSKFKIERALQRKYGGRVIFQQFGAEALDARRRLYEEAETNGDLMFHDPDVRHMFYYYFHMKHTFVDHDALERAWSF